jgi:leucyl-tRNA synthetase
MVVQVDGKVRDRVEVDADASDQACRELALASEKAVRAIDGRQIAQVVVRAPRLVNVVTSR